MKPHLQKQQRVHEKKTWEAPSADPYFHIFSFFACAVTKISATE